VIFSPVLGDFCGGTGLKHVEQRIRDEKRADCDEQSARCFEDLPGATLHTAP